MPHFLTILHPVRDTFPGDGTPEEFEIVHEHLAYLQKNLLEGKLILAGPTRNSPPMGIGILEVEDYEAAVAHLANDPAVLKGLFRYDPPSPFSLAVLRGRDEEEAKKDLAVNGI